MMGKKVAHYLVLAEIGRGGMGVVYQAEDLRLGRHVALKCLSPESAGDSTRLARFQQEARAASALNHPNICTIYEIGEHEGAPYIAMELLSGVTLKSRLAIGKLPLAEIFSISLQVLSGIAAAHARQILHRDIKPANIFLCDVGRVKLLDFGMAKQLGTSYPLRPGDATTVTSASQLGAGTVAYMSPEQARGESLDGRSDLFSYGVALYEMATGQKPFPGETQAVVFDGIFNRAPASPRSLNASLPLELENAILKALNKEPARRFQSAEAMAAAISAAVQPAQRANVPAAGPAVASSAAKRRTFPVRTTTAVTALILLSAALFFWLRPHVKAPLPQSVSIVLADVQNTTGEPVFDDTLRQALEVQLGQSPYFTLVGRERMYHLVRLAGYKTEVRITPAIARDLCQRQGAQVALNSAIARLGSEYVISLDAVNCTTGENLAREQVQADSRDHVLRAVDGAAAELRARLGESLASIKQTSRPSDEVTTSSLDALRAYSLGNEWRAKGVPETEAIPFYKHAIELDPNFALAYARIATIYGNIGEHEVAAQYIKKAYELRNALSEREQFYITSHYYDKVTGESDRQIASLQQWKAAELDDSAPPTNLSELYSKNFGDFPQALSEAQEARRRAPGSALPYDVLGQAYLGLGRYSEAEKTFQEAVRLHLDDYDDHIMLIQTAAAKNDAAAMQRYIAAASDPAKTYQVLQLESDQAALEGRLKVASEAARRAAEVARHGEYVESSARIIATEAVVLMQFGDLASAKRMASQAAGMSRAGDVLALAAVVLASAGDRVAARDLANELQRRYPSATLTAAVWMPCILAAEDLNGGDGVAARNALEPARRYQFGMSFHYLPIYLRGLAYLQLKQPQQAIEEFQSILDHRGVDATSPLHALARLQLARAQAMAGDISAAAASYDSLLALWKNADPNLPLLMETRRERAALKR